MEKELQHTSVLPKETLDMLNPQAGERALDVTLGLGGHSLLIAKRLGKNGSLTALDADIENIRIAGKRLSAMEANVTLTHANFRMLPDLNLEPFDVILADLGLSSPHIDMPERGFSFRFEGPLDLRFDRTSGRTAAELILEMPEQELHYLLKRLGEVPRTASLTREMKEKKPSTTFELRACVESVYGYKAPSVLPQIFQALRIAVNDEIGALSVLLAIAPALLKPGGRFAVISFHSLEDRMVKDTFRELCTDKIDDLTGQVKVKAPFTLRTKKPIRPSEEEQKNNPRSRSALLRGISRVPDA